MLELLAGQGRQLSELSVSVRKLPLVVLRASVIVRLQGPHLGRDNIRNFLATAILTYVAALIAYSGSLFVLPSHIDVRVTTADHRMRVG